jgi:uncharacterized radical SAM superfamily Fe-S cluster-containing enzyme
MLKKIFLYPLLTEKINNKNPDRVLIPFCIQDVIKAARRRRRRRMFIYVEEPTTQATQMPLECELELKADGKTHRIPSV